MRGSLLIVCLLASLAHADKAASLTHYEKGKKAYAAGNFALAATEFEAAYAAWNTPEYFHDIGQAYRRLDRCNEAATAFERYLAAKPDAPNRTTVSDLVKSLRVKCPAPGSPAPAVAPAPAPAPAPLAVAPAPAPAPAAVATSAAPPTAAPRPIATASVATSATAVVTTAPTRGPSRWHPTARAGIVMLDAGPVVMPPIPELAAGVLRDVRLPLRLQLGANLSVARLPFDDVMSGTVWLAGPEAVATASHPLTSRLALTGAVAMGAQLVSGLSTGNPFTMNGEAHAAFVTLRLRGELGIAWRASERFSVRLTPGYVYTPRRAPLAPDINALHGLGVHAGVSVDL